LTGPHDPHTLTGAMADRHNGSRGARPTSVGHRPNGPWQFDASVAAVFDDMLQRSIPLYEVMRETVGRIAIEYCRPGRTVVDLGAATGEGVAGLVDATTGDDVRYVAVECSRPMLEELRDRFGSVTGTVTVVDHDLRRGFPDVDRPVSLVLSVLTLQFVAMEYRQRLLRDAYESLEVGGALILVEKVLGDTAAIDALFVREYLRTKMRNGYSPEDIERKRLSLEGVLVPVTARWNEEMLRHAGFAQVDCFWRWLNFAGWLALKA